MRRTLTILAAAFVSAPLAPCLQAQDFQWASSMGAHYDDYARGVTVDASGNVYTVGYFGGTADFDPGPGTFDLTSSGPSDIFVQKLDASGNLLWARAMGGAGDDYGYGVTVDAGGNVYTTGYFLGTADFDPGPGVFNLTSAGDDDIFVSKLDSGGNFVWAVAMGGAGEDYGYGLALDAAGNVHTVGYYQLTADFDPGPGTVNRTAAGGQEIFVSKLDAAGQFVWVASMGGPSDDSAYGVALDPAGNVHTAGYFDGAADFDPGPGQLILTSGAKRDAFVAKLDSGGNIVWASGVGGSGREYAYDLSLDASGNTYTAGYFHDLADFDPGPGVHALFSAGIADSFLLKLDVDGGLVWVQQLGAALGDYAYDVARDADGNIYTIGFFQQTVDFDPGPATYTLTSSGVRDVYVQKLDPDGNFLWAAAFGGVLEDYGYTLAVDSDGGVIGAGYFQFTADFDPGPGTENRTSAGGYDAFVARLSGVCGPAGMRSLFGLALFDPRCTTTASGLPGGAGVDSIYDAASVPFYRSSSDRVFLTGHPPEDFAALAVDDEAHVNGNDSGLGPYSNQPGVPPLIHSVPIEENLVPEPSHEITGLVPAGESALTVELVDTQRQVYGNTHVYLALDCRLLADGPSAGTLDFRSRDDLVAGSMTPFEMKTGLVSVLRSTGSYAGAACLGPFPDTPATDTTADPPAGDARWFLARGLSGCTAHGFGDAKGLAPDPRDALDAAPQCP